MSTSLGSVNCGRQAVWRWPRPETRVPVGASWPWQLPGPGAVGGGHRAGFGHPGQTHVDRRLGFRASRTRGLPPGNAVRHCSGEKGWLPPELFNCTTVTFVELKATVGTRARTGSAGRVGVQAAGPCWPEAGCGAGSSVLGARGRSILSPLRTRSASGPLTPSPQVKATPSRVCLPEHLSAPRPSWFVRRHRPELACGFPTFRPDEEAPPPGSGGQEGGLQTPRRLPRFRTRS